MQSLMILESSSVLQFVENAVKAVATVEVIDRSPLTLRDAILREVGNVTRIQIGRAHV